jgi:dihydrofolate reductase
MPMGTIVAAEYLTVDGVMQDPGGVGEIDAGGWSGPYWVFAASWPDPEHEEGPFADKMNSMPKYVASRTLKDPAWNAKLIEGDVADEIGKLKSDSDRKLLIYGSASIVRLLLQHDLIDECRLMIHPVVLGVGEPLFAAGQPRKELRLTRTTTTGKGVVVLDYERAE